MTVLSISSGTKERQTDRQTSRVYNLAADDDPEVELKNGMAATSSVDARHGCRRLQHTHDTRAKKRRKNLVGKSCE
jgi:hypothetical protein